MNPQKQKLLIIGGVAAGTKAAARARRENPGLEITVVTRDQHISYAGCGLPYYIGDVLREEKELLVKQPEDFHVDMDITVLTLQEAQKILPEKKVVIVKDLVSGETRNMPYDKLLLATGADPFVPPLDGRELDNIFTLRTVADAFTIKEKLRGSNLKDAVVIGGGMIGLEAVENLVQAGIKTTVVELAPYVLPPYDYEVALHAEKYLREHGVEVLTGTAIQGFTNNGQGEVGAVLTSAGIVKADFVILAVGVRPNVALARQCGITLGLTGAIAVNQKMETNIKDIYAAGDCAENINLITGQPVWLPMGSTANKTGRVAANNLAGTGAVDTMPGVLGTSVLKLFELNLARTGLSERDARAAGYDIETVLVAAPDRAHFYPGSRQIVTKLIVDRKNHRVLGGQVFGEGTVDKPIDTLVTAITFGATVEQLAKLDLGYAPPFSTAMSSTIIAANVMLNKLHGKFKGVNPLELQERMASGAVLVDVRLEEEFFVRSIPGSINIPAGQLMSRLDELDRTREIILNCKVGLRSYTALLKLKQLGFENVSILEGGMGAYPFATE